MKKSLTLKDLSCAKIAIICLLLAATSCSQSGGSGGSKSNGVAATQFGQPNFDQITFYGDSYDKSRNEAVKIESASASLYRNQKDGLMKIGFGFAEKSFSPDPCSVENQYSHNPSDANPKQRLFSIINIPLIVGVKQPLTNTDFWRDQISPGGRVYFFDTTFTELFPSAYGDVTLLNLTDDSVTVKIENFSARDRSGFKMNGLVTVRICK